MNSNCSSPSPHVPLFGHCTWRKAGSIPSQLRWNLGCINSGGSRGVSIFLYFSAPLHHNLTRSESFLHGLDNHDCQRPDQVDAMNATRQFTESGNLLADTTHVQKKTKREHYSPANRPVQRTFLRLFQSLGPTCRNLTSVRHVIFLMCGPVTLVSKKRCLLATNRRRATSTSLIKWTVVIDVLQKQIYSHWRTR